MKKHLILLAALFAFSLLGMAAHIAAQESASKVITVELTDKPAEEVLAFLFKEGKVPYSLDESAQSALRDTKVTASIHDMEFEPLIHLLTSALGLAHEKKDGAYLFKAGPADGKQIVLESIVSSTGKPVRGTVTITVTRGDGNVRAFSFSAGGSGRAQIRPRVFAAPSVNVEKEVTLRLGGVSKEFTCPHCKRSATVQSKSEPRCSQCKRRMQDDFKFCPYDGTRLSTTTDDDPKFCPFCGKGLDK